MPPSQAPTGWDVRFLARGGQRQCERTGEEEGRGQESRDPGKAPDRVGRGKLLVENRLEGTRLEGARLEGTRMEGNRPGEQQQMQQQQPQRWLQQLQLQQQQNPGRGGEGGAGRYPEPDGSERPARRWPACDKTGHNKRRDQHPNGDDAPPW